MSNWVVAMGDEVDKRAYLSGISNGEERARAIVESGWVSAPEIDDLEAAAASLTGGPYQQLLASLRKAPPPTAKRALQRMERVRKRRPNLLGETSFYPVPADSKNTAENVSAEIEQEARADAGLEGVSAKAVRSASFLQAPMKVSRQRISDQSSLAAGIERHLYENQKSIWPHVKEETIPQPIGYVPAPARSKRVEPFKDVTKGAPKRERSSDLRAAEVVRLYDAISFSMQRYGAPMNAHIIILWEGFGVVDHEQAARVLSMYLQQALKWARVGTEGRPRQRRRERTGSGFEFRYVYVHENGAGRGFHTHILCTLPGAARKAFENWSWSILKKLTGPKADIWALRVVGSLQRTEGGTVDRCWNWFRYVTKQTSDEAVVFERTGKQHSLRDVMRPWSRRASFPVTCTKLVGGAHSIWLDAQQKAGFTSRLRAGDLTGIFDGTELSEFRMRQLLPNLRD